MVLDALRGYVQMASGLTEVNRQRAVAEAKALLAQRGAFEQLLSEQAKGFADDVGRQVQSLADDLLATSKANRAILLTMIRSEVEHAVGSLGLASSEELSALRRRVDRLDQRISAEPGTAAARTAAKKSTAKKSTAKKSTPSATKAAKKAASSAPAATSPTSPTAPSTPTAPAPPAPSAERGKGDVP